jgi:trimethylamine--corrinoid protein Co-methyltransferase
MSSDHDLVGIRSSLYKPLNANDVTRMATAVFEVLEKSGVAVYSDEGFEAFAKAGAEVDRETRNVKLSRSLVEDCIDSNPSTITLHARDGKYDAVLEKDRVHYGTGGTAIFVLDPDTGERRPSTVTDVILNARMVNALENIHVFTINVFPNEIEDQNQIDVNRFFHAFDNTTKHVMGGVYSAQGCRNVVKMAEEIAGGGNALRAAPFVSFITLIISPFKIDKIYGDMTCYFAREGLPVVVPTEPIAGSTSPVSLAGNVLTHVAETVAGICLVQCINRGAPGICGSVGSIPNLRTMDHLGGPIERAMVNAASSQMAQNFGIPMYSTGGTTDAKEVDPQCAYETAMSSLLAAMSGANYIHDIAGLMESDLSVSYEKLVIDNEILGMNQRVLRGIEVNDDTLAVELISKVCRESGSNRHFLAERHTVDHMRSEHFFPTIANREKRARYRTDDNALARARAFVTEIRSTDPESLIDPVIRNKLLAAYPEIIRYLS